MNCMKMASMCVRRPLPYRVQTRSSCAHNLNTKQQPLLSSLIIAYGFCITGIKFLQKHKLLSHNVCTQKWDYVSKTANFGTTVIEIKLSENWTLSCR